MTQTLTGRHVLIIAATAFGIIIAANMAMLMAATGSFPGLIVKNSYVASQGWNARTEAQNALGWQAALTYQGDTVSIDLRDRDGMPVRDAQLTALIGRPSNSDQDMIAEIRSISNGYAFTADLAPGLWRIQINAAEGPEFQVTASLLVPETR